MLEQRILVFDGAMGTSIQDLDLSPEDFGGEEFDGCNEYLNLVKPEAILGIHNEFLEAGADIIETNTFGSTPLVLGEYGLQDRAREISRAAGEIARRDFVPIPPDMKMDHLVSEMMLVGRGRCYPVVAGDELLGLITLTDAQQLDRNSWPTTSVYSVMTPFDKLRTVSPLDEAAAVLQLMSETDVNQVPVVEGNRIVGIISRADILRLIQVRRAVATEA